MISTRNELSLDEIKNVELDILRYLKKTCADQSLRYYLAYGTLLGAVRHFGFIPWDDDIDVFMPYNDYIKLVEYMSGQTGGRYQLVCRELNPDYTAPLAKLIDTGTELEQDYGLIETTRLGVYIDIFVLNGAGNTHETALEETRKSLRILKKWILADSKLSFRGSGIKPLLSVIHKIPYRIVGYKHYLDLIYKYREEHEYDQCQYITQTCLSIYNSAENNLWTRNDFAEGTDLPFEKEMFRGPKNYDAVLRAIYGDYMTLPSQEDRSSGHLFHAYWRTEQNDR